MGKIWDHSRGHGISVISRFSFVSASDEQKTIPYQHRGCPPTKVSFFPKHADEIKPKKGGVSLMRLDIRSIYNQRNKLVTFRSLDSELARRMRIFQHD